MEDPNNDSAALAASEAPDPAGKKTPIYKNKKLIYFLIFVLIFLIPLAGLLILGYVNKTSYIPLP
jgi:hypothetical protein